MRISEAQWSSRLANEDERGLISEKWYLGATDTSFIERDSTVNIGYRADGIHRFWTYNTL